MKRINLLILVFILISAGCKNEPGKVSKTESIKVKVTGVTNELVSIPVHAGGIVTSSEETKLSFKIGGIVAKINAREGDEVKKGDVLAALNLSEIDAQVEQAKNGYDKALRDYSRASNLYRDSVVTLEQMQNAATAMNVAKSNLDIALFNRNHARIIAPDKGKILKQFVKTNELISSGYPMFLFGTSGKNWKVKAGISDRDIIRIYPGDSAVVTLDAYPDEKFKAIVDQVSEISNPLTGTYEIELNFIDEGHRLASGFVAGLDVFPSKKKSLFLVPVEAIVEADGQTGYVYYVTSSMIAQKIKLTIETIAGSKVAVNGIPEGITEIVSEGAAYLKEGALVEILK